MLTKMTDDNVLGQVLDALKIVKIVWIDDSFERPLHPGVEDLISLIAQADDAAARQEVASILPELPDLSQYEVWTEIFRSTWEQWSPQDRHDRSIEIATVLGGDGAPEAPVVSPLGRLISADSLVELTPTDWEEHEAALLEQASSNARTLFLFDLDLSDSGRARDAGLALLAKVSAFLPTSEPPRFYCGLLSATFSIGEEESQWRNLSPTLGERLKRTLPLSKDRLSDANLFAEGIQWSAINFVQEQLKESAWEVAQSSLDSANDRLRNLSVWDFHHIVTTSSQVEGTPESETLYRILAIFERKSRNESRQSPDRKAIVEQWLSLVRKLSTIKLLPNGPASGAVRELRREELYWGSQINYWYAPLEMGDIFKSSIGQHFLLLAQPCDLMLRLDGRRVSRTATLLKIKQRTAGAGGTLQAGVSAFSPTIEYFDESSNTEWCVELKRGLEISLDVLDISAYRADGSCQYPIDELPDWVLHEATRSRLDILRTEVDKFQNAIKTTIASLERSQVSKPEITDIRKRLFSTYGAPELMKKAVMGEGAIDFGLVRVDRLTTRKAYELLVRFADSLARDAFEHDFAQTHGAAREDAQTDAGSALVSEAVVEAANAVAPQVAS